MFIYFHYTADSALNCTSLQPIITNNTKNINATHVTDVSSTSSVSSTTKQTMDTPGEEIIINNYKVVIVW